ncbi:TetR/AcrR family transcriptional regulator [Nocardiopsis sediminis]|uniref:TetR/AcrR family transcriptional regulator n=1 Tax=Nocardiopsis sediminis TaxID=1778267 RepID=A0ABV8FKY2_9ACTN
MTVAARSARAERAEETREQIMSAAERLFADHGVRAVSNRQVSEAAGQGNNFAVGYHFGGKEDLVRAIARKHSQHSERRRRAMVAALGGGSDDVRDWVACLVRPVTGHLAELGSPTWFARFAAQAMADPSFAPIMVDEALTSPALQEIVDGIDRCLPALPAEVRTERDEMAGSLIITTCARRERALANGTPTHRSTWDDAATGLIDAIAGLWQAPVTPARETREVPGPVTAPSDEHTEEDQR